MKKQIISWGNKQYEQEWHEETNFNDLSNVHQVYAYIFDNNGLLLIVNPKTTWRLPGGHPDRKDKTFIETLIRETEEEADVEIEDITPLGYIKVTPLGKSSSDQVFYQIRYIARLKKIKKQTIDIAEGIINDRKFINTKDFSKYCQWGEMGEEILSKAIKLNQQNG